MSRTSLVLLGVAAVLASAAARPARAHGVDADVDQREGAVAVRLRYHGGRPLADARYEVESPRGGDAPFAEGRTDRHGWLAFTPDVAGRWTVRIADATGHGKTVAVDVASVAPAAAARAADPPPTIRLEPQGGAAGRDGRAAGTTAGERSGGGYALRVLAGVTAIVVVFRLLLAAQRTRRGKG